jgi:hypothetical protein
MTKRTAGVVAIVFLAVLLMPLFAACGSPVPPDEAEPTSAPTETSGDEEPTTQPASSDGEALLQERCATCHSLDRVKQAQKSNEEWQQSVTRMVNKGAKLSENEQMVLVEYLTETYGP